MSPYTTYYEVQAGGGGSIERYNNFGRVYAGRPYQRGNGIGSWLGGLFRTVLPYFKSAAGAVGKEALNTGLNVMGDIVSNKVSFKEALDNRLTESGLNLKRKAAEKLDSMMRGSGYKRKRKRRTAHKLVGRGTSGAAKKKSVKKKKTVSKKPTKKTNVKYNPRDVYDIFA